MSNINNQSVVVKSTARVLNVLTAKYTSPDPQSFDVAAYSMQAIDHDVPSVYTAAKPEEYTQLPPIYLDEDALDRELESNLELYSTKALPPDWAQTYHYTITDFTDSKQVALLCQYILVLDALNFCFWPLKGYEYEHLAGSLKRTLVNNPHAFDAENLAKITPEELSLYLQPGDLPLIGHTKPVTEHVLIPLINARVRLLREVGSVLLEHFNGLAYNLIHTANQSAVKLVSLMTQYLPGFRDHSQYYGDQIFLYKRVQIFVGDVWGAFNGQYIGTFHDMEQLTCFPDYRIPQLFRSIGILKCNEIFQKVLDDECIVLPNSEEEILIRALTVQIVEKIKYKLLHTYNVTIYAYQLDWLLWERGEAMMKNNTIVPHHRTLTTYY